jgi:hypothetical protein
VINALDPPAMLKGVFACPPLENQIRPGTRIPGTNKTFDRKILVSFADLYPPCKPLMLDPRYHCDYNQV